MIDQIIMDCSLYRSADQILTFGGHLFIDVHIALFCLKSDNCEEVCVCSSSDFRFMMFYDLSSVVSLTHTIPDVAILILSWISPTLLRLRSFLVLLLLTGVIFVTEEQSQPLSGSLSGSWFRKKWTEWERASASGTERDRPRYATLLRLQLLIERASDSRRRKTFICRRKSTGVVLCAQFQAKYKNWHTQI